MTLNGVMAVALRYFTDFGKHALQHITTSFCGGIYVRVYHIVFCRAFTMSSVRKFTFAISSPGEFLVSYKMSNVMSMCPSIQIQG